MPKNMEIEERIKRTKLHIYGGGGLYTHTHKGLFVSFLFKKEQTPCR